MQSNREQFTTEIYVNQEQANDALGKLRDKVAETGKAYEKLLNTQDADVKQTLKAKNAWEAAKKSLESAETGVDEYRKALDNLSGQSMGNLVKMQKQLKKELDKTKPGTEEWARLSRQYGQVTDRVKTLRKEQNTLMSGMGRLRQGIGNVTEWFGKFGTAIMAVPTAIKGVVGALGGVISVTRQVINASQTMGDKWSNGMAAMKTTTDAFFMALSTGDWTAFNNGILGALKNARDLAETMDLLASYQISADYMRSEYLTSFQEHINNARDTGLTEEERKSELDTAKKDLEAYSQTIKEMADTTRESLIQEFKAVKGIDYTGDIEGFDAFFDELYKKVIVGGNNMVTAAKEKLSELQAEYVNMGNWSYGASEKGLERVWVPTYTRAQAETIALKKATEEFGEEVMNLARASELGDDALKGLLERYKQSKTSEREILTQERQMTRVRNQLYGGEGKKTVDAYAEAIKKVEKAENAQLTTLKSLYSNGLMDKQTYEAQKAVVEEDFLKQRLAVAQKYGKDTDQFMNQLLDRQIARMEKAKAMLKEEADEMARYYEGLRTGDERQFGASTGSAANGGIADQEAYEAFQEKIWAKANEIKQSLVEDSARTEYETQMKWIEKLHKDGLLSDEEFEKAKLDQKLGFAAKIAQEVNRYAEMASNFSNALKEAETVQLEAEYQKQLTAAGDNAEERERIEAEYEQKKLDMQKKYADIDMAINIAKTIANGAAAAIKAYMEGGPYAGPVLAALIAATTAAEVATIIAQRNAIKATSVGGGGSSSIPKTGERKMTGYSEGGFTPKAASDSTAVGVVHANEYVAPAWMVRQNPVTFANLERYRKAGSHGRSGSMSRGFADGGFTGDMPKGMSGGFTTADIEAAVEAAIIKSMAMGAIRAYLVRKDLTELDNQTQRFKDITAR